MHQSQPRKLGSGLSALFEAEDDDVAPPTPLSPSATKGEGDVRHLPIELIRPNPQQPRKFFDETELEELASSMRTKGVLQPIMVRPIPDEEDAYELVAGERRWRAAQKAQIHQIPAIIRPMDDDTALEIAIIENIQRADLNAMEEASGYQQLKDRYNYTQEQLARCLGKSRPHIANMMRLMNLPPSVQALVRTGELSAGHARVVLMADDPEEFARKIIDKDMSVRDAEKALRAEEREPKGFASLDRLEDANTRVIEGELEAALRMPVTIKHKGESGGELRITYHSLDDLDDLCRMLRGERPDVMASG